MMPFTDATGLLGCALAFAAIVLRLPGLSRLELSKRHWAGYVILILVVLPLGGLSLAGYLRGGTGDLSMPSLLLLALFVFRPLQGQSLFPGRTPLLALIAGTALLFYPMALGVGSYDPYRLGFGSDGLLAALLILSAMAMWRGWSWVAGMLAAAVLAWAVGWYESANLWDYLLDPLVATYALAALVRKGLRQLFRRKRAAL